MVVNQKCNYIERDEQRVKNNREQVCNEPQDHVMFLFESFIRR